MSNKTNVYFTASGSGNMSGNNESDTLPISALNNTTEYDGCNLHIHNAVANLINSTASTHIFDLLKLDNCNIIGYTDSTFTTQCTYCDRGACILGKTISSDVTKTNIILNNCNISGITFASFYSKSPDTLADAAIIIKNDSDSSINIVNCEFTYCTASPYVIDFSGGHNINMISCNIDHMWQVPELRIAEKLPPYQYCIGGFYNRGIPDDNRDINKYWNAPGDLTKFKNCNIHTRGGDSANTSFAPGIYAGIKYRSVETANFPFNRVEDTIITPLYGYGGGTAYVGMDYYFKLFGWGPNGKYERHKFVFIDDLSEEEISAIDHVPPITPSKVTDSIAYSTFSSRMCGWYDSANKQLNSASTNYVQNFALDNTSGYSYENALPVMDVYALTQTQVNSLTANYKSNLSSISIFNISDITNKTLYVRNDGGNDDKVVYCFHQVYINAGISVRTLFKPISAEFTNYLLYPGFLKHLKHTDNTTSLKSDVYFYEDETKKDETKTYVYDRQIIIPGGASFNLDVFRFCFSDGRVYAGNVCYIYDQNAATIDVSPRNIRAGSVNGNCVKYGEYLDSNEVYYKINTTPYYPNRANPPNRYNYYMQSAYFRPYEDESPVLRSGISWYGMGVDPVDSKLNYPLNENGYMIANSALLSDDNANDVRYFASITLEQHHNTNQQGLGSNTFIERYSKYNIFDTNASQTTISRFDTHGLPSNVIKWHSLLNIGGIQFTVGNATTKPNPHITNADNNIQYIKCSNTQGLWFTSPPSSVCDYPINIMGTFNNTGSKIAALSSSNVVSGKYQMLDELPGYKTFTYIPNTIQPSDYPTGIRVFGNNITLNGSIFSYGSVSINVVTNNLYTLLGKIPPDCYTYVGFKPSDASHSLKFTYSINGSTLRDGPAEYPVTTYFAPGVNTRLCITPFTRLPYFEQYNSTTHKYEPCTTMLGAKQLTYSQQTALISALLQDYNIEKNYMRCGSSDSTIKTVGPIEVVQIPINPNKIDYGCTDAVLTINGISPKSYTLTHKDSKLELVCNIKSNDYRAGNKFTYQWYCGNELILGDGSNVYSTDISVNNISSIEGSWYCEVIVIPSNVPPSDEIIPKYCTNKIDIKIAPQGG